MKEDQINNLENELLTAKKQASNEDPAPLEKLQSDLKAKELYLSTRL
jgi:hypothetical protein